VEVHPAELVDSLYRNGSQRISALPELSVSPEGRKSRRRIIPPAVKGLEPVSL
jgi:hypothetical protein